jgi:hypothetical protein
MAVLTKHAVDDDVQREMALRYLGYFVDQVSKGEQVGDGYWVEHGIDPNQFGEGWANMFGALKSLFKPLAPVLFKGLKKAGKAVGKQALLSGMDMLGDVSRGKSWEEAADTHLVEGARSLVDRGMNKLDGMVGRGKKRRRRTMPKRKAKSARTAAAKPRRRSSRAKPKVSPGGLVQHLVSLRSAAGARGCRNPRVGAAPVHRHQHYNSQSQRGRGYSLL